MLIYWNPDMHYILQWREYTLSAEIVMEERHIQAGRRQEREQILCGLPICLTMYMVFIYSIMMTRRYGGMVLFLVWFTTVNIYLYLSMVGVIFYRA